MILGTRHKPEGVKKEEFCLYTELAFASKGKLCRWETRNTSEEAVLIKGIYLSQLPFQMILKEI